MTADGSISYAFISMNLLNCTVLDLSMCWKRFMFQGGKGSYNAWVIRYLLCLTLYMYLCNESSRFHCLTEEQELHDWIWDVIWLHDAGHSTTSHTSLNIHWPGSVGLCLGHNSVVHLEWTSMNVIQEVHCKEKCILYPLLWMDECLHAHFSMILKFTTEVFLTLIQIFSQIYGPRMV